MDDFQSDIYVDHGSKFLNHREMAGSSPTGLGIGQVDQGTVKTKTLV